MKYKKRWFIIGILLACCIAINLYSSNNQRVETGYSHSFYPAFSQNLRAICGWIPFSIGDLVYGIVTIYLAILVFRFFRFVFSYKKNKLIQQVLIDRFTFLLTFACLLYIFFNIFWGINYNRVGIAAQLNLPINKYSIEELKSINNLLVEKINDSKQILIEKKTSYPSTKDLFAKTATAYTLLGKEYPFLAYKNASIKPSMWGWLGNYIGFLGYYNPLTGEAQVNTTVPKFTQPFTACHEVAHQLGYAKEMEANFVGYLAASRSDEPIFRYAVYTDLFTYANRTLYIADSASALECRKELLPEVIADFRERRKFYETHTSFAEPIFRYLYGKFLEQNQQPMGILSYDEVTAFIIAYYKKFGTI